MIDDMKKLYKYYGFDTEKFDADQLLFRMKLLGEEFRETMKAYYDGNPEELVDGFIDICVIAIGTLNLAKVDTQLAWNTVFKSNMSKTRGVKPGRSGGMDVVKEPGKFISVSHKNNTGLFDEII